jgi:hypothetical protein
MSPEECSIGQKVRINTPDNPVLHDETGTICEINDWDEVGVRFDVYKAKFDDFEDSRRGYVMLNPWELELI